MTISGTRPIAASSRHDPGDVAIHRDVTAMGGGLPARVAQFRRERLELFDAPRHQRDAEAAAGEFARQAGAYPARSAGDQRQSLRG